MRSQGQRIGAGSLALVLLVCLEPAALDAQQTSTLDETIEAGEAEAEEPARRLVSWNEFNRSVTLSSRYATLSSTRTRPGPRRTEETTFGVNWFFARHDNKLTFDVSRLSLERVESPPLEDSRVRLQWDISF